MNGMNLSGKPGIVHLLDAIALHGGASAVCSPRSGEAYPCAPNFGLETLKILTELGEAQAEMKTIFESTGQALG